MKTESQRSQSAVEVLGLAQTRATRSLSLAESAAALIGEMILSGELKPGSRLPPERELARALGLSRSPLREGLHVLESVGLLEATVGRGRFVTDRASAQGAPSIEAWMQLFHTPDVIAVRRLVEPQAIRELPRDDLEALQAQLERTLRQMDQAQRRRAHLAAADHHQTFHALLIHRTPNRLIRTLCLSMLTASRESQHRISRSGSGGRHSLKQHRLILEAISQRDLDLAAQRVAEHLTPVFSYPEENPQ